MEADETSRLMAHIERLATLLSDRPACVCMRRDESVWCAWVTRGWAAESAVAQGRGTTAQLALQDLAARLAADAEMFLSRVELLKVVLAGLLAHLDSPGYGSHTSPEARQ